MRRTVKPAKSPSAARAFELVLVALERELVSATDEEIVEAARDLGMNLGMKGSAAFAGLKFPSKMALRDWFGPEELSKLQLELAARAAKLERPAAFRVPPKAEEPDGE
jgi:hypothetical protein